VVGLAIVLGNARKKVFELQQQIRHKGNEDEQIVRQAKEEAERILAQARLQGQREADTITLEAQTQLRVVEGKSQEVDARRKAAEVEAREILLKARDAAEKEAQQAATAQQQALEDLEKRSQKRERVIREKEDLVASRELELTRREKGLQTREQQLQSEEARIAEIIHAQEDKLQQIAGMSSEDAKNRLMERYKDDARRGAANDAKRIEDEAREEAEKKAKRIIGLAIQRFAGEYVQDRSVTSVHLPNDELKGRIIGREGRNIRALQEATGVDFIVDDTPETIVVSSFDPIRREVARIALEKLIVDGRIHPTRIEEVVTKSQEEVERAMREAAEQAMLELSITRVHPEIVKLLGRLRYRYS